MAIPAYPGHLVKKNEADLTVVRAVQKQLKEAGYLGQPSGQFDDATVAAVRLFQAQHFDAHGNPLTVDGKLGPFTWARLFRTMTVEPSRLVGAPLLTQALGVAVSQVGVREVPEGSNRGPMVDQYLDCVGIPPRQGNADQRFWCAGFVYWCFKQAAVAQNRSTPLPKTAGCLDHWRRAARLAAVRRITKDEALQKPALIRPGIIFIQNHGGGAGHTGIVERLESGRLFTVEGNIAEGAQPGRNGVGVFRTDRRKLTDSELEGFIDYSAA